MTRANSGFAVVAILVTAGAVSIPLGTNGMLAFVDGSGADDGIARFVASAALGPANEASIAVNPTDPLSVIAVAKDYSLGDVEQCGVEEGSTNVWAGVYSTVDGGASWRASRPPGFPGDEPASALSRFRCASDPVIAFGPDGTAYLAVLAYWDREPLVTTPDGRHVFAREGIYVTRSVDGGLTWDEPSPVLEPETELVTAPDKEWLSVDPATGRLFVVHHNVQSSTFFIQASADGGRSWGPPVPLGEGYLGLARAGGEGRVHVAFLSPASAMMVATSLDGGATFMPARPVALVDDVHTLPNADYRVMSVPTLAVHAGTGGHGDVLHLAWADRGGGSADIVWTVSRDSGLTWSLPAVVNDNAGFSAQFMPWMDVDAAGGAHVVFYDRRHDPADTLVDVTYAFAPPGGAFGPNVRLTLESFDPSLSHHQAGDVFIGDYIGIDVDDGPAWAAWADTSGGRADVVVARIPAGTGS